MAALYAHGKTITTPVMSSLSGPSVQIPNGTAQTVASHRYRNNAEHARSGHPACSFRHNHRLLPSRLTAFTISWTQGPLVESSPRGIFPPALTQENPRYDRMKGISSPRRKSDSLLLFLSPGPLKMDGSGVETAKKVATRRVRPKDKPLPSDQRQASEFSL